MALGGLVPAPTLTVSTTGVLAFTCLVDAHAIQSPSTPIPVSQTGTQTTYFAITCPTCGTRYLVEVIAPQVMTSVQQTS